MGLTEGAGWARQKGALNKLLDLIVINTKRGRVKVVILELDTLKYITRIEDGLRVEV